MPDLSCLNKGWVGLEDIALILNDDINEIIALVNSLENFEFNYDLDLIKKV